MLINRLAEYAEKKGFLTQFGFRKARNTEQAVAMLHWILEARCLEGRTVAQRRTYCAFLDCRSAFDSVWHEGLCVRMYRHGIRGRALAYLRASPLMSSLRTVRCGDASIDVSRAWRDTRGVAQGVIGAPFAFAIMAADLIKALGARRRGCGVRVGSGARVCSISYADDIVLIADSPGGLQRLLHVAYRTPQEQVRLRAVEMRSCRVWGTRRPPACCGRNGVHPRGEPLKISPEFRYLGVQMARQVETRGAARTMAEVRRRAHRQSSRRG